MTHSEEEVVEELSRQFEQVMQIDSKGTSTTHEEEKKEKRPVFKSKKERSTLNEGMQNVQRKKRRGMLIGQTEQKKESDQIGVDVDMEEEITDQK